MDISRDVMRFSLNALVMFKHPPAFLIPCLFSVPIIRFVHRHVNFRRADRVRRFSFLITAVEPASTKLCHPRRIVIPDLIGDPLSCHPRCIVIPDLIGDPLFCHTRRIVLPDLIGDPIKMDSHFRGNDNPSPSAPFQQPTGFPLSWE